MVNQNLKAYLDLSGNFSWLCLRNFNPQETYLKTILDAQSPLLPELSTVLELKIPVAITTHRFLIPIHLC
jgi:hypothetical protein